MDKAWIVHENEIDKCECFCGKIIEKYWCLRAVICILILIKNKLSEKNIKILKSYSLMQRFLIIEAKK